MSSAKSTRCFASTLPQRFWKKVKTTRGCWFWIGSLNQDGYGMIGTEVGVRTAHRVSWIINRGEIPGGKKVLHRCDNPQCVRPSHLFIGTHADNMRDMEKKGRAVHLIGQAVGGAKHLTRNKVEVIRKLCASGQRHEDVAKRFNITRNSVSRIVRLVTWK